MYCIKWKMTILFQLIDSKLLFFIYFLFKDYYIFCIDIYIYIYYLYIFFQLNSIITCYVCVQLIKFLFINVLCRIRFY